MGGDRPPLEIIGAFSPIRANLSDMEAKGFIETGLRAIYPTDAKCLTIESHFGVTTRYDRSTRNFLIFKGRHGGADISAPGGTPLLAIADGTVIRKQHGVVCYDLWIHILAVLFGRGGIANIDFVRAGRSLWSYPSPSRSSSNTLSEMINASRIDGTPI